MAIRTYALWGRKPRIRNALVILWIGCTAASISITVYFSYLISPHVLVAEDVRTCIPGMELPPYYYTVWIPALALETLLFGMMLFSVRGLVDPWHSVAQILLRDGILYFVLITLARFANLALYFHGDPSIAYIVCFFMVGLGSTLLSRGVMNLRGWRSVGVSLPTTPGSSCDPVSFPAAKPERQRVLTSMEWSTYSADLVSLELGEICGPPEGCDDEEEAR